MAIAPSTQTSAPTALPTPASSVKGGSKDEDTQMTDAPLPPTSAPTAQDTAMPDSTTHSHTNHNRHPEDTHTEGETQAPERLNAMSEPFYFVLQECKVPLVAKYCA
jgi:hypothetical protein